MTVDSFEGAVAPANPYGPSPVRRAVSVRRTSTIDTVWPEGMGKPMLMHGHARDIFTRSAGAAPLVLAEDDIRILASQVREILEIAASRRNAEVQRLVGQRGGGKLRAELAALLPDELAAGSVLNLLLDDFSGASLVAGWAFSRWTPDWQKRLNAGQKSTAGKGGVMIGICSGFRPGASGLFADGTSDPAIQSSAVVPPLPRTDDPEGWHALDPQAEGVGMRRARRIDVWLDDGLVRMDVGFQDSATSPTGGDRIAVHEYHVTASADPDTFELLSVTSDPRVLPYRECPGASPNVSLMVGTRLKDLRLQVPRELSGIVGCTHLNDVLRSISDVPQLVERLRQETTEPA